MLTFSGDSFPNDGRTPEATFPKVPLHEALEVWVALRKEVVGDELETRGEEEARWLLKLVGTTLPWLHRTLNSYYQYAAPLTKLPVAEYYHPLFTEHVTYYYLDLEEIVDMQFPTLFGVVSDIMNNQLFTVAISNAPEDDRTVLSPRYNKTQLPLDQERGAMSDYMHGYLSYPLLPQSRQEVARDMTRMRQECDLEVLMGGLGFSNEDRLKRFFPPAKAVQQWTAYPAANRQHAKEARKLAFHKTESWRPTMRELQSHIWGITSLDQADVDRIKELFVGVITRMTKESLPSFVDYVNVPALLICIGLAFDLDGNKFIREDVYEEHREDLNAATCRVCHLDVHAEENKTRWKCKCPDMHMACGLAWSMANRICPLCKKVVDRVEVEFYQAKVNLQGEGQIGEYGPPLINVNAAQIPSIHAEQEEPEEDVLELHPEEEEDDFMEEEQTEETEGTTERSVASGEDLRVRIDAAAVAMETDQPEDKEEPTSARPVVKSVVRIQPTFQDPFAGMTKLPETQRMAPYLRDIVHYFESDRTVNWKWAISILARDKHMTFLDDKSSEYHAWNAARVILRKVKANVETDHFFTSTVTRSDIYKFVFEAMDPELQAYRGSRGEKAFRRHGPLIVLMVLCAQLRPIDRFVFHGDCSRSHISDLGYRIGTSFPVGSRRKLSFG